MINPRALAHIGGDPPHKFTFDRQRNKVHTENLTLKLLVETRVTAEAAKVLRKNGRSLVQMIEATGLTLEFSASQADGDIVVLFNVWDMNGDANTLIHADYILPDEPAYSEFGNLIITEIKNIGIPLTPVDLKERPELQAGPSSDYDQHVRMVHHVVENQLSEFVAQREAGLIGFAKKTGWKPIDAYLSVTGESGQVIPIAEIWKVPHGATASEPGNSTSLRAAINSAPWQQIKGNGSGDVRVLDAKLLPKSKG